MSAHTPGPWFASALRMRGADPSKDGCDIGAENGANVAIVLHQEGDRQPSETVANANLIAAGPELLAIGEELESVIDAQTYDERRRADFDMPEDAELTVVLTVKQFRALSAALNKAEGRAS